MCPGSTFIGNMVLKSFLLAHDNVSPWPDLRTHVGRAWRGWLPVSCAQSMLVELMCKQEAASVLSYILATQTDHTLSPVPLDPRHQKPCRSTTVTPGQPSFRLSSCTRPWPTPSWSTCAAWTSTLRPSRPETPASSAPLVSTGAHSLGNKGFQRQRSFLPPED